MSQGEGSSKKPLRIKRGKVDSLSLYEITDYELGILERGTPAGLFFNFAVFLLSSAISFLTALLTTEIKSSRTYTLFLLITIVGFVVGAILLALWYKQRQSTSDLISQIKSRIPADELGELAQEEAPPRKRSRSKKSENAEPEDPANAEQSH
jgi:hypothetical protein